MKASLLDITKQTIEILRHVPGRLVAVGSGLAATFAISTSLAVYSDVDAAPQSHFETGTLSLALDATTALFNVTATKPGDVVYAPLTLTNTGSIDLAFTMTSQATDNDGKHLAAALTTEVTRPTGSTCNAAAFTTGLSLIPVAVGIPNATISAPQTLATGASLSTCFRVSLPLSAPNSLQGSATDVSFTFNSTQA